MSRHVLLNDIEHMNPEGRDASRARVRRRRARGSGIPDGIRHLDDAAPPGVYVGSTTVDACLPGLRAENDLVLDHEMSFSDPDFDRFPRFREAVEAAQVADLEAGDALFYPAMWWHQVEAVTPFNAMINYWWNTVPSFMGTPMAALKHALLSLRDRPEQEKRAWKHVFDYYVFGSERLPREHLPEPSQGELGPLEDVKARRLRAELLAKLNR
jgi:hypothetical protein